MSWATILTAPSITMNSTRQFVEVVAVELKVSTWRRLPWMASHRRNFIQAVWHALHVGRRFEKTISNSMVGFIARKMRSDLQVCRAGLSMTALLLDRVHSYESWLVVMVVRICWVGGFQK